MLPVEAAAWFCFEVKCQAMKDKSTSCKIKYVCFFGVLRIAIWETQIPGNSKVHSGETKEVRFSKEGIYISCFEQNVIGAGVATVTLTYMWSVARASVRQKVHLCPFYHIAHALDFSWVQQKFQEFETRDMLMPHLLNVLPASFWRILWGVLTPFYSLHCHTQSWFESHLQLPGCTTLNLDLLICSDTEKAFSLRWPYWMGQPHGPNPGIHDSFLDPQWDVPFIHISPSSDTTGTTHGLPGPVVLPLPIWTCFWPRGQPTTICDLVQDLDSPRLCFHTVRLPGLSPAPGSHKRTMRASSYLCIPDGIVFVEQ